MPERLLSTLDRAVKVAQNALDNEGLGWLVGEPRAKLAAWRSRGPLPTVPASAHTSVRRITFVSVEYDGLCRQNLLASPAVAGHRLVLVKDPHGLRYGSLARALAAGLADTGATDVGVLALVGQDVWLPERWPAAVETALSALERVDRDWGVAGISGVDEHGRRIGHASDPWGLLQTLGRGTPFAEALALDDGVLLFREGSRVALDLDLPGFEGTGRSVSARSRAAGRRCYVIDAPAVVERFDDDGRPVTRAVESRRIRGQLYRQQRVQRQATLEYLAGPDVPADSASISAPFRWSCNPARPPAARVPVPTPAVSAALEHPLILLGKGGGGSRLLSLLAADCGVFVGRVNISGDCLDMVPAVYSGVLRALDCSAAWQRARVVDGLRQAAAAMLGDGWSAGEPWGFKVPEALLLVRELHAAFPGARFLLMSRHPVATCLRRSHMTAQLDNPIGRVSVTAAYRAAGLDPGAAQSDPIEVRGALVTRHQVGSAVDCLRNLAQPDRYMEIHFEDVVARPAETRDRVAAWLGLGVVSQQLERAVDASRAGRKSAVPAEMVTRVESILASLTESLGYEPLAQAEDRG